MTLLRGRIMSFMRTVVIATAISTSSIAAPAAIVLTFTPTNQQIGLQGTTIVEVAISGLGRQILSAFDLNFKWDPAILHWTGMDAISGCNELQFTGVANCSFGPSPQGNVHLHGLSPVSDNLLAANQDDSFVLARIGLLGMNDGTTNFGLGLDLSTERKLLGRNGLPLQVDIGSTCVAVGDASCSTVPEPSSVALSAIALAAIGVARRRKV